MFAGKKNRKIYKRSVRFYSLNKDDENVARTGNDSFSSSHRTGGGEATTAETEIEDLKENPNVGGSGSNSATTTKVGFGSKENDPMWQCVKGCGACCKLDKGPSFPSPEEIFDDPSDQYRGLIGSDGWCKHFERGTRTCSIYTDRPYFCRVEPENFETLYGIDKKKFNKEACSCCLDTIKAVYGSQSAELESFNHAIWSSNRERSN